MKSVVATRYGGPEALAIASRDEPALRPGDVRIRVRAASLNPIDFKIRQGKLRLALPLELPIALGCDVAGVVDAVGERVSSFAVGDEVYARLEKDRMGGLSELVAADQAVVARKPARATFEEAAAVPLAGLTALQALREAAGLTAGQRVLVHAGAGGVGSLGIQIGKALGLWVATTTSTKNVELVTGLGADLVIDYTRESPPDRLSELDAVFDTLGGQSELEALTLVRRGGTVVGIGGLPDAAFARARLPWWARPLISVATLRRRRAAARTGARFVYLFMRPDGAELAELAAWIDDGRLRPLIHRAYPLADVGEAFAELERGRARGKIVVTIPA
jgi:alcohol dehydrogenase